MQKKRLAKGPDASKCVYFLDFMDFLRAERILRIFFIAARF